MKVDSPPDNRIPKSGESSQQKDIHDVTNLYEPQDHQDLFSSFYFSDREQEQRTSFTSNDSFHMTETDIVDAQKVQYEFWAILNFVSSKIYNLGEESESLTFFFIEFIKL